MNIIFICSDLNYDTNLSLFYRAIVLGQGKVLILRYQKVWYWRKLKKILLKSYLKEGNRRKKTIPNYCDKRQGFEEWNPRCLRNLYICVTTSPSAWIYFRRDIQSYAYVYRKNTKKSLFSKYLCPKLDRPVWSVPKWIEVHGK